MKIINKTIITLSCHDCACLEQMQPCEACINGPKINYKEISDERIREEAARRYGIRTNT